MNEELLNYIWQNKLIDLKKLLINFSGEKVVIIDAGTRNLDSGPDFFNARIKIGNTIWAGNVEVHVRSSDWILHNHQNDDAYDNIILHVVYQDDSPVYRKKGEKIPTIELKNRFNPQILSTYKSFLESSNWIPCDQQIARIDSFTQFAWLDSLCIERLELKAKGISYDLKNTNQDFLEILYRQLGRSFGFNTNADAFELLTKSLPFSLLAKHINRIDQLEALLYGQAGMLNKSFRDIYPKTLAKEYTFLAKKYDLCPVESKIWKYLRMRPSNFPTIRISQFANLLQSTSGLLTNILEHNRLNDVKTLFNVHANSYWRNHSNFDKVSKDKSTLLGKNSIDLILINTIIPFTFIYGKVFKLNEIQDKSLLWYEQIKPEKNHITSKFSSFGLKIENAKQSQAVIQLKKNYCDKKRCLSCRFGHWLISGNL